ncbi:MAG: Na(+)/H(+) antiporter subunit F [Anaerolineales bacterium]|nr:Na(+)/H(+) antiporter subunit F [Anaerolineales bacterium]
MLQTLSSLTIYELFSSIALMILTGTGLLVLWRVWLGPSIADRVVAIDIFSAVGVAIISVYAVVTGEDLVLDVALILALLSFLGTAAFAYYIDKRQ